MRTNQHYYYLFWGGDYDIELMNPFAKVKTELDGVKIIPPNWLIFSPIYYDFLKKNNFNNYSFNNFIKQKNIMIYAHSSRIQILQKYIKDEYGTNIQYDKKDTNYNFFNFKIVDDNDVVEQ